MWAHLVARSPARRAALRAAPLAPPLPLAPPTRQASTRRAARRQSSRDVLRAAAAQRRARAPAGAAATADDDDGSGDDEWELDDSPGLEDADDGVDDAAAADDDARADPDEFASGAEQADMAQRMLAIAPPVLAPVDPLSLLATEFTPLAPGVRWLRLADVGVVAAVPRGWRVYSGAGRLLGIPLRTHVACYDPAAPPVSERDGDSGEAASQASPLLPAGGVREAAWVRTRPPLRRRTANGRRGSSAAGHAGAAEGAAAAADERPHRHAAGGGRTRAPAAGTGADASVNNDDSDDDDGEPSAPASPLLTGKAAAGPEAHALGLTITCYRGAFASQLLAGAHGSPRDVATFFTQLHMMRRQPEGLVRQGDFANRGSARDEEGGRGGGGGGGARGGRSVGRLRSALDSWPEAGTQAEGATGDPGHVGDAAAAALGGGGDAASLARRPSITASWSRALTRGDAMAGVFESPALAEGVGEAEGGVRIHVPRALGPAAVLGMALPAAARGGRGGRGGGGEGAASSLPTGSASAAVTMNAPLSAVLRRSDALHVFGLEYELAPPPPPSAGDAAVTPRGGGAAAAAATTRRFNVSLILDPVADCVTEVTFACPAHQWGSLWDGDRAHPDDARDVGLAHVTGKALLDAATVAEVPSYEHWRPGVGGL